MNRIFFIVILFGAISMKSQHLVVLDFDTKLPVQNCAVTLGSNSEVYYSNEKGEVDLSFVKDKEELTFWHISYTEYKIIKEKIKDNVVYLFHFPESLNEVILSVSKKGENVGRIAEHVEVNTQQKIRRVSPQTSADLLANTAGVKVQKSQSGGGSPVLRGMEANRVLLVVDGVRMNNAIYRSGHLQNSITVSPSVLERTEVVFGPSSVIYGSDALGGVIHYYTMTPSVSPKTKVNASYMTRFSSINEEFANQGNIELSFKKWASLTSASFVKFGDVKMGGNRIHGFEDWGKVFEYSNNTDTYYNSNPVVNDDPELQKNTSYDQIDLLQKFLFQLSDKTDLIFNVQYSNSSNIPRFDKLTEYSEGELKFAEWYYGPQERFLSSGQLILSPEKKWMHEGKITAAYQRINESRINRKFNSLDRSYREEGVDVYSLNGDFSVPLSHITNSVLSYGMELTHNNVSSTSYGKTISVVGNEIIGFSGDFAVQSRYPDGGSSYSSGAIYTSYKQDIGRKSTFNTGIRYTGTFLKAKWEDDTFITLPENDVSLDNNAFTANLGYIYRPNINWQLSSVISSGFRSPNIDDIGKIREKNGKVTVPNIYLKPEYAYNAEIGLVKYFNKKQFNLGFNAFYTFLHHYIARTPYSINGSDTILYDGELLETYANVNHGNAFVAGGTFSFRGVVYRNWQTSGSVTYTKGETYDTNSPLSSIPPVFGNAEIGFFKSKFETSLNFRFNGQKLRSDYNLVEGIDNIEQTPIDPNTGEYFGSPSWYSINFYSKYKFTNVVSLQFRVDNIFDQHYKEFASAVSALGRNYSVSLFIN